MLQLLFTHFNHYIQARRKLAVFRNFLIPVLILVTSSSSAFPSITMVAADKKADLLVWGATGFTGQNDALYDYH